MKSSWIPHPTTLSGKTIELRPLEEEHFLELTALASEKRIWEHYTMDGSNAERFSEAMAEALEEREAGRQYPLVVIHKGENKIIGSTRLLHIQPAHRKLEIGWTWLHPNYWGGPMNRECKDLLLTFCFERLNCVRVQLKTDELNVRSRKAIEKIGGQFEGIIRNDMIRDDETYRNSASYSILAGEWR